MANQKSSLRMLSSSLLGAADQAVLSAFSLVLGMAFIRLAPKSEYAVYALLSTVVLLAQSLQNALVSSPMTTLLPAKLDASGKDQVVVAASRIQLWLVMGVVVAGLVIGVFDKASGHDRSIGIAALVMAAVGVLSREFARARYFIQHKALRALLSDLLYVLLGSATVGALVALGHLSAAPVLGAIGLAGLLAGLMAGLRPQSPFAPLTAADRKCLLEIWACARWALPSVVTSWLYANGFLFVVAALMSKESVADLSASRLLLVPLSLVVVGWSNAFRPRASQWFSQGQSNRIHAAALKSAMALIAVMAAYGVLLYVAMPFLESTLLGHRYDGLGWLMCGWLAFFVISAVRGVGMCSMLASPLAFRELFFYGLLALAVTLPGVTAACLDHWTAGVLIALSFAELTLAVVIWFHGWPRLRRTIPVHA